MGIGWITPCIVPMMNCFIVLNARLKCLRDRKSGLKSGLRTLHLRTKVKCFLYLEDELGHTYYGGDTYGIAKFDSLIPEHVKISHVSMVKSHGYKQMLIKACSTDDVPLGRGFSKQELDTNRKLRHSSKRSS